MSVKCTGSQKSHAAMLRVKQLRKARGWSVTRLTEELQGIGCPTNRSTIENYDNLRRAHMTVDELYAFAAALGTTADDLVNHHCSQCDGEPPEGFVCGSCGTGGRGE